MPGKILGSNQVLLATSVWSELLQREYGNFCGCFVDILRRELILKITYVAVAWWDIQYPRKDKYKNYQQKSGKSALIINEGATVNTWANFTMVLKGTYLFNLIFLEKYDVK